MIRNIIFDLGGVIMNIDERLVADAFRKLGVSNFAEAFAEAIRQQIPERYETGKMTTDELRAQAKKLMAIEHVTNTAFDHAWNTVVVSLPKEHLEFVRKFKTKYQTYLLSNINELHLARNFAVCYRDTGVKDFSGIFHKEYYSHLIGMRKPDPEIFKLVLNENALQAHETLFVDDTLANILSAKALGINTHHVTLDNDIFSLMTLL